MLHDLIRAFLAAVVIGVLPGYFWAGLLCACEDRAERLVYGIALSITLVPATMLLLTSLFGVGATMTVTIISIVVVFAGGLAAYLKFGPAKRPLGPLSSGYATLDLPSLLPLIAAFGLMLAAILNVLLAEWAGAVILLLVLVAGVGHLVTPRRNAAPYTASDTNPETDEPSRPFDLSVLHYPLLAATMTLVLLRAYLGPLRHDWPYIRGVDQYEHVVMTDMMVSTGSTESFMLYPPGFHLLMSALHHLSGLEPIEIFPTLAPALLGLVALGLYALARRMWGWEVGVAAALLGGLVAYGPYMQFAEGRYPNLLTGHFILVVALAALFTLYGSPTARSGLLLALLGSSVVLYHQVASLYLAALLGLASLCFLPYLLLRERRSGMVMFCSFALVFILSVLYAWDTYDLPSLVAGLLGIGESGVGGDALTMALGTQPTLELSHLLAMTTHPVLWLGVLGVLLILMDRQRSGVPYAMARVTLLVWGLMLFVGTRTEASGFPERYERDLSIPLSLFAAFALMALLRSLKPRMPAVVFATSLATLLVGGAIGVQALRNLEVGGGPVSRIPPKLITLATQRMLTPKLEAAGDWLRQNNDGGNILVTPYLDLIPSRAMLALGGYTGVQSFDPGRIELARDLPPSGAKPLEDALFMLQHPDEERTRRLMERYDVRYVVLYKAVPPKSDVDFRSFKKSDSYREVFENDRVVILEPREAPE